MTHCVTGYRCPIRVLQVVTSTQRRGAEVFAVDLGEALEARGCEVRTVALTGSSAEGTLVVPALGDGALHPSTLRSLRQAATGSDVVVAHGSRTLPACAIALLGTGVPFVYRNIGDPTYWSGRGLSQWRTRMFLSRAAHVVAISPAAADTLRQSYGVPPRKVTAVPTGVPARRHLPVTAERRRRARTSLGLAEDVRLALVIGALSEEKCVSVVIDAVAQLAGVELLVAGDGPERAALETQAVERAAGRVHFVGALSDPSPAYDAADVVVLASRSEGLPAVLIEAGMRTLPVVATDVGYVRDVVSDGETGYLVPFGDASALTRRVAQAIDDVGLGRAALDRCARFDLDRVADDWVVVLRVVTG